MTGRGWFTAVGLALLAAAPRAQTVSSARVAILLAEERGARDARDLAMLRAGIRNANAETARAAIRALGRLGRPALIADIMVALRSPVPELRAEAADAIASALAGPQSGSAASAVPALPTSSTKTRPAAQAGAAAGSAAQSAAATASALSTLLARLGVEAEPSVRGAICEALGRLPYSDVGSIARAESALVGVARSDVLSERLGAVRGLESIIRKNAERWLPNESTIAILRELAGVPVATTTDKGAGDESIQTASPSLAPSRDARIRRLAFEALTTAGRADTALIQRGAVDPDAQVRWLAMRAAGVARSLNADVAVSVLHAGMSDPQPMVRTEALRGEGIREKGTPPACRSLVEGAKDPITQVVLVALDLLGDCGAYPDAVELLEHTVNDLSDAASPRGWHRAAHALLALSGAAPDRASAAIGQFTMSTMWPLRAYAARAATVLKDRAILEKLSTDVDGDVAQVAGEGLGRSRPVRPPAAPVGGGATELNAADLQRLAAPRARVTIRGVGSFELALFTSEAPAAVLRFARSAQAGSYNGTTLGGLQPTLLNLIPADGPGAIANTVLREVGSWPHVRGALGFASGEARAGGAQIFIDLVDNPRFDHEFPVFAQVLNGIEVVDRLLEGDVIERIEILTGP